MLNQIEWGGHCLTCPHLIGCKFITKSNKNGGDRPIFEPNMVKKTDEVQFGKQQKVFKNWQLVSYLMMMMLNDKKRSYHPAPPSVTVVKVSFLIFLFCLLHISLHRYKHVCLSIQKNKDDRDKERRLGKHIVNISTNKETVPKKTHKNSNNC